MKKPNFLMFLFIVFLLSIGIMIWNPGDRQLQKRAAAMQRCVEIKIFPTQGNTSYQIRFEDEFFCPTQPYTVLEALNRAESVFNTRNKPLQVMTKNTQDGVTLDSMLGKNNRAASGTWELAIDGNQKFTQPLDKIFLQGKAYINFVYREKTNF